MIQIPLNGSAKPFVKGYLRLPSKRSAQTSGVKRVAPIVSRTVVDMNNGIRMRASVGTRSQLVKG